MPHATRNSSQDGILAMSAASSAASIASPHASHPQSRQKVPLPSGPPSISDTGNSPPQVSHKKEVSTVIKVGGLFQNVGVFDFRGIVRKNHREERPFRAPCGFVPEVVTASHPVVSDALESSALTDRLGGFTEIHPLLVFLLGNMPAKVFESVDLPA
jgi:hypothetical protein